MARICDAKGLPATYANLIASLSNSAICGYDNIGGGKLDSKERSEYIDALGGASIGLEIDMRMLYPDNVLTTCKIRNHLACSAITTPFGREDLHRRTLHLTVCRRSERWTRSLSKKT